MKQKKKSVAVCIVRMSRTGTCFGGVDGQTDDRAAGRLSSSPRDHAGPPLVLPMARCWKKKSAANELEVRVLAGVGSNQCTETHPTN